MARLRLYYPLLFAALLPLHLAANNTGKYALGDLTRVVIALVLAALALHGLVRLLTFRFWRAPAASLLVFTAVAWFFAYEPGFEYATAALGPVQAHAVLLSGGLLVTVAAFTWVVRRRHVLDRVSTLLGTAGSLVVVWTLVGIARDQFRERRWIAENPLVRELAEPVPVAPAGTRGTNLRRDIYAFLLDEYANDGVLREFYGFDNQVFLDSLRVLGFTIPRQLHSNYTFTTLSLPSLFNFAHLHRLGGTADASLPHYLQAHNRAAAFLKRQGYRFLLFPSQWWISTRHSPLADVEVEVWSGLDLGQELTRSDLRRVLRRRSPLTFTRLGDHRPDADFVRRTLRGVADSAAAPSPKFILAHVLNPHTPYVFDRACRVTDEPSAGPLREPRVAYVEQVSCLNTLVLDAVRRILASSRTPPIIILQGDHGPKVLGFNRVPSAERITMEQARERLGAFGAYYLPEGGAREFEGSLTLVNVFPKIFNYYFGTTLPMSPDDLYLSPRAVGRHRRIDPTNLEVDSRTRRASGMSPIHRGS